MEGATKAEPMRCRPRVQAGFEGKTSADYRPPAYAQQSRRTDNIAADNQGEDHFDFATAKPKKGPTGRAIMQAPLRHD